MSGGLWYFINIHLILYRGWKQIEQMEPSDLPDWYAHIMGACVHVCTTVIFYILALFVRTLLLMRL